MQLSGVFRFVPARSRARVVAHAPGHAFRCEGPGIEGLVELTEDRLVRGHATFPLAALAAGDPLGDRELKKFLGVDPSRPVSAGPVLSAELEPAPITPGPSGGIVVATTVRFTLGAKTTSTRVRIEGTTTSARAELVLSFTSLGFTPPKLLFLRVKDTLDIEISSSLTRDAGP
ncbi:hypothetical protein L6R52_11900 [Myxococcota bacterium]|nr:hypothetical protein [Myxococcota bacterium]